MAASPQGRARGAIFADLKRAFPRQEVPAEMMAIYARELADINDADLDIAVREVIRTGRFFPTVAELRAVAAERSLALPSPEEALAQVESRMQWARLGRDGDPPAVHPLVREALDLVGGWHSFKAAENPSIVRSQFLNLYREKRAHALAEIQVGVLAALPAPLPIPALPEGDPQ